MDVSCNELSSGRLGAVFVVGIMVIAMNNAQPQIRASSKSIDSSSSRVQLSNWFISRAQISKCLLQRWEAKIKTHRGKLFRQNLGAFQQ
jgi:hypothetical protein